MDNTTDRISAYKVGFLTKLAELGILPDEMYAQVKKADLMETLASGGVDVGKQIAGLGLSAGAEGAKWLGYGALAAPVAAGGGVGMAHALLDAPSDRDIESMRKTELINLYKRITQEVMARRQQKVV
jgi:hypothetical protein